MAPPAVAPTAAPPNGGARPEVDWAARIADEVEARVLVSKGPGAKIVCASGISPSGPVHLGNLRELMTTHIVAEELRARGREVEHLHSWDDFDRLRKVPVGVPEHYSSHIGSPIGEIPDPWGKDDSYGSHFRLPVEQAAAALGITCRWVRQSHAYRAGDYRAGVRTALLGRATIFDVLDRYRTAKPDDKPVEERRAAYWPLQIYCDRCSRDSTTVQGWDEASDVVAYTCARCGPGSVHLGTPGAAVKLPWKADWPMRWAHEKVDFEPGGEDHSTPGGSFTVGTEIVRTVFGWSAPHYIGYAFVGMAGRTKISSSTGTEATPEFALRFIEPALLRFLYLRRAPGTKFTIDFGADIWRQYDEWDAVQKKVDLGTATVGDRLACARSTTTSAGPVAHAKLHVPFRLLWTAADMTSGNLDQIVRIVQAHLDEPVDATTLVEGLGPRLECASGWVAHCLPEDERLHVRTTFDEPAWAGLDERIRAGLTLLVTRMADAWTLPGLTALVYGVPKVLLGLDLDAPPTPEMKLLQRAFFVALYQLVLGSDTGPRLPTLFLSLGLDRMAALLVPPISAQA